MTLELIGADTIAAQREIQALRAEVLRLQGIVGFLQMQRDLGILSGAVTKILTKNGGYMLLSQDDMAEAQKVRLKFTYPSEEDADKPLRIEIADESRVIQFPS